MKIKDNPGLINDKAIDVLVEVARRTAPDGRELSDDMVWVRRRCRQILQYGGLCIKNIMAQCPDNCNDLRWGCGLYVKSK